MLSLITALYKSDRYLESYRSRLLPFLAEMDKKNIPYEVILVPKDPSPKEQEFINGLKVNSWCREISSPNPSLYGSWNSGVLEAKGDVLGFWNVDDWRYSEGAAEAYSLIISKQAELVYSPFRIRRYLPILGMDILVHVQRVDKQVPEYTAATRPEFLYNMHCTPFFMFSRALYFKAGPFDEQFKIVADFEWCARASKLSENFRRGKQLSGSFRVDGRGASAGGKPRHMAENNIVYIRHNQAKNHPLWLVPDELMQLYKTKTLIFRGREFNLDNNGLMRQEDLGQFKNLGA